MFLSNEHIHNFCEAVELIPDAVADKDTRRLSSYYGASLFLLTGLNSWPMLRRFCAGSMSSRSPPARCWWFGWPGTSITAAFGPAPRWTL